ncbi:MAG: FAD-binding oxidoreductase [Burkholderiales bacterium]|jgi:D-arginine dehydrogenase|nr:FAD-binding oxidoreductase [Burkholderiales bacterium]
MVEPTQHDFIVIGAGMAGASIAAELAARGSVALLEAEPHAGYHATGRSAALFSELYGNAVIRALTRASRTFLFDPPAGFAEAPLVRPRPCLFIARADQAEALADFRARTGLAGATLDAAQIQAQVPILTPDRVAAAALDTGSADIDVDGLLQGCLRRARQRGAQLMLDAPVRAISRHGGQWRVDTGATTFAAPVVINAAGAWANAVAGLAGVAPVPLQPLRRTAMLIDAPAGLDIAAWPAVVDVDEQFYFKPDAGLLLISPADEHPSEPCDAQPEELDIAIAADRFERATGLAVQRVRHRWAGLRVFAPDRTPVVGFAATSPGFFWLAGQGGYGIQTAPALARLAAALACREALPSDLLALGLNAAALSPARFCHPISEGVAPCA